MENHISHLFGLPVTELVRKFPTPFYLYDRTTIESRIEALSEFDTIRYAQKALSNIAILSLMRKKGVAVDAVSAGEIYRALKAGYKTGDGCKDIVYTADIIDPDAIPLIKEHKIHINAGSPDMVTQLAEFCPGAEITLRINPGFGHGHSRKVNTGGESSKHGIWHESLEETLRVADNAGIKVPGLHMHIGSGTDFSHLSKGASSMIECGKKAGSQLKTISAGGGIPVPYKTGESHFDVAHYASIWKEAKESLEKELGVSLTLEVEPGRFLVAESGALVTTVCSVKQSGSIIYYLVNAGFDTLVRPAMYGAYHRISIASYDGRVITSEKDAVVAGPLCESCDVFTQDEEGFIQARPLPEAVPGDFLILHTAGAYGSAMSSNYNSRLLCAEVMISDGNPIIIRQKQTLEDLIKAEHIPTL